MLLWIKLSRRHADPWRHTIIVVLLASFMICGWLAREALLRGAASLWIVSDPVTSADAIVVLGGNFQERPLVAANLYRRGLAGKVLVSQMPDSEKAGFGANPSNTELNRTALVRLGVPMNAIENFGTANTNTRDEAVALREWAKRNAASTFIIPSEIFSARRIRWIFDRQFTGSAVTIEVPSFEQRGYTRNEWWKTDAGVIAFRTELLKYVYYRLKY